MANTRHEEGRPRAGRRARVRTAAAVVALACCLGGCHGNGYYAVYGHHHGGHYHGYGGHSGATGDGALLLLAFYGAAALLSWCFN